MPNVNTKAACDKNHICYCMPHYTYRGNYSLKLEFILTNTWCNCHCFVIFLINDNNFFFLLLLLLMSMHTCRFPTFV